MTVGSTQPSWQISLAPNLESSGSPLGIRLQFHDTRSGTRRGRRGTRALGRCQLRGIRAVSGRDSSLDPGGQQLSQLNVVRCPSAQVTWITRVTTLLGYL